MYKSVEYKFKKNSIYNKRIIRLFIIYVSVCILLFRQGRTGEEAPVFPALLIPNPDNSTAAPRPLSGCTVPRWPSLLQY